MWALRDAVAFNGDYRSFSRSEAFYRSLRTQIIAACHAKRLECRHEIIPFMPAMRADQWDALPRTILRLLRLATSQDPPILTLPSSGDAAQINQDSRLLGNPLRTWTPDERGTVSLSGWYVNKGAAWIALRCGSGDHATAIPIPRKESPDVAMAFHRPDASAQRFRVQVPSAEDCAVEPADQAGGAGARSIAKLALGSNAFDGGTLYLENKVQVYGPDGGRTARHLIAALATAYKRVMPVASALGLLAYLAYGVFYLLRRRWRRFDPVFIAASGVWVMLLARAAILVLVDISSFPAVSVSYWNAGFPLLCLAIGLSFALWRRTAETV